MMDLSDHYHAQHWQPDPAKAATLETRPTRSWTNEQKRGLRERIKRSEADEAEDQPALVARERARWHHELRWEKDDEWKRAHDAVCDVCTGHKAEYFGLDDRATRQVRYASPIAVSSMPCSCTATTRPKGDGKRARQAGILRPPSYPWGESER